MRDEIPDNADGHEMPNGAHVGNYEDRVEIRVYTPDNRLVQEHSVKKVNVPFGRFFCLDFQLPGDSVVYNPPGRKIGKVVKVIGIRIQDE